MPITATDVIEVLGDPNLRLFNFSVGPIQVDASRYANVAEYIELGAIKVVPWNRDYSEYIPGANTIKTRAGDPPMDYNARTNLLHECTHAIGDIENIRVSRLTDEVAAYLAQVTYLLLIFPSTAEPRDGSPVANMMLQMMHLVEKYNLGKPEGMNATIDPQDIQDLVRLVHLVPDYNFSEKELSDNDGVSFTNEQLAVRIRNINSALLNSLFTEETPSPKVRQSARENYVTWDPELTNMFTAYARGSEDQRAQTLRDLAHIFATIDQPSAQKLLARVSSLQRDDAISQLFQNTFPDPQKQALIAVLLTPR